ncbi:5'-nucleotidase C-terminal domain-containing protein [Niameybacter massiliensis]|uniref:5'-nucleotidase C-terminal domain-containing protein n=1 Tax=Holtiella tumoricola TaxID=3018743 RepID=A0AA42J2P5_9FIRM|nr:5'-nucleotidase C-terminal domain-containing protein [Holtiella tumoricola]MDA3733550.1 5'-nucleotidase C-terminal domain-containing protein [Holtiella tumoricola]
MESKFLTLIQMNDVHGYISPHPEVFFGPQNLEVKEAGGYARIKSLVDQIRREKKNSLFLDCGDTFHGTFITTQTHGNAIVPILNEMGLDAMTAHWDFAYTPSKLRDLVYELNYPLLAANVYRYDTKQRVFDPYIIKEIDGMKIGIFGMACQHVVQGFPQKFSQGIYMSPEYKEAPIIAAQLRNKHKCDIVVMLSHLGMPTDYEIISKTTGIDICISGHTHNRLNAPIKVGNALLIQSGCHGSFIGELDVEIINGRIIDYQHKLIPVTADIPEDERIGRLVMEAYKPYKKQLDQVVGKTNSLLCRDYSLESTMDNFLLHSISYATGRKICFSHGWRYGAPIPPGNITENNLYNIVPMNPKIINVDLKGYEIVEMLEDNINHTYSRNPFGQIGGYLPRAIGIKAYIKIENPHHYRIQKLFAEGRPLEADTMYQCSYITEQGVPQHYGTNREKLNITAIEAMKSYLAEKGNIEESYLGTFTVI